MVTAGGMRWREGVCGDRGGLRLREGSAVTGGVLR